MAPGFSWAHDGADGGDLITAAATGGVAHPAGYPTFLLLARLFQFLPVGTIAYRTNLMSAVFTALSALFAYDIVVWSPNSPAKGNHLAGLIAGYAYGLSFFAWSQAVITEVYGLHGFFVALILWLLVGRFAYSPNKLLRALRDAAIGLSVGLGMGNHLTTVLLLPAALLVDTVILSSSDVKKKDARKKDVKKKNVQVSINWASLGRRLGGVFVGLLVYTFILRWAASGAPVNWGYAVNLQSLWWLVSGALYQGFAFSAPIGDVLARVIAVAELLLTQFGVLGLIAGLYHLFRNSSLSRLSLVSGWVAVVNIVWSLSYATTDSYVYLLPFFLVFAIWIGLGIGTINRQLAQRKNWISLGASAILLVSFLGMAVLNYPSIDLSRDHSTEKFAQEAVTALPPQAIVVTGGDNALFGLWYYHFVLKERPDIAVVGNGLLPYPWYRDVLHDTYPALNVSLKESSSSHDSIAQANPARPVCDVVVDKQISIVCYLPLSQKPEKTPFISITQPVEQ
jgi:hypothetical protein